MTEAALQTIEAVHGIIEEENQHLKSGDIPAAVALLKRKESALEALNQIQISCAKEPESEALCCTEEIPEAARKLDNALQENRSLLKQAMTAQNMIVRLLTSALPHPTGKTQYSNKGSYVTKNAPSGRAVRNSA